MLTGTIIGTNITEFEVQRIIVQARRGVPAFFFLFLAVVWLSSCAIIPRQPAPARETAFVAEAYDGLFDAYSPVFIVENYNEPYNRIGTVRARMDERVKEDVFVDPIEPSIYVRKQNFSTGKGHYTNLIYRVHFEKIPFSLFPFNLTMGKNIGLFVIVTLNKKEEPILFTTVHTCGCYLAFIPTSYLPEEAYPEKWKIKGQRVFREKLPGILNYPEVFSTDMKPVVSLKSETHRITDIRMERTDTVNRDYNLITSKLLPLDTLKRLAIEGGGTTSFFETSGARKGYVKKSHKPWEKMLVSWWAFDWRVGEDKVLGESKDDGIVFYTSLKFWERESSDMRDFVKFIEHWGWGL